MTDFETHPAGTADLVKRLRSYQEFEQNRDGQIVCVESEIANEAADHIEQLVATIEQLEATLTRANAATAAAYEVAAREGDEFMRVALDDETDPDLLTGNARGMYFCARQYQRDIRALATPDQTAALDKMIAEAVGPYVEALENIAQEASVPIHTWQNGINFKRMYEGWRKIATERIDTARAILAASKKGGV